MRLTVWRAVFASIVIELVIDALWWTRIKSHPIVPSFAVCLLFVRAVLYAGIAVLAVRAGRHWSAPLPSVAAALAATLIPALLGILTGQFLARGIGPAAVLIWMVAGIALSALSGTVGSLVALLRSRQQNSAAVAG
jgi:hypothetical protein